MAIRPAGRARTVRCRRWRGPRYPRHRADLASSHCYDCSDDREKPSIFTRTHTHREMYTHSRTQISHTRNDPRNRVTLVLLTHGHPTYTYSPILTIIYNTMYITNIPRTLISLYRHDAVHIQQRICRRRRQSRISRASENL